MGYKLGKAAWLQIKGQRIAALDEINEFLSLRPGHLEALGRKTDILMDLGWFEDSIEVNNKILRINPDDIETLYVQMCLLRYLDQYDEAGEFADVIMNSEPADQSNHWVYKADVLSLLGYYDKANRAYLKAERLAKNIDVVTEFKISKANHFSRHGEHGKAVEMINQALEIERYGVIYWNKSSILAKKGDFEESQRYAYEAIQARENAAVPMNLWLAIAFCLCDSYKSLESYIKFLENSGCDSASLAKTIDLFTDN
ncbi:MAG: tetratricopeptide repeat protein [Methanohalobium sp.]|uniref:tetratricopeptide repeat protein n=1 Tax=Methanohalobium sp. TaxID=2837493 RepID=UPI00397DAADF